MNVKAPLTTCVAFLRGINVNGHRIVKMAALREAIATSFADDIIAVKTWIQTGNVLIRSRLDTQQIESKLLAILQQDFGLDDVPIMVRTADELHQVMAHNPFAHSGVYENKRLFVAYLDRVPITAAVEAMGQIDYSPEQYSIHESLRLIYFVVPDFKKYKLDTPLFEKKLQIAATSRNWNVMNKIMTLIQEMETLGDGSSSRSAKLLVSSSRNKRKAESKPSQPQAAIIQQPTSSRRKPTMKKCQQKRSDDDTDEPLRRSKRIQKDI